MWVGQCNPIEGVADGEPVRLSQRWSALTDPITIDKRVFFDQTRLKING